MARMSKAERLVQVHREALKSFNNIQVSVKDERIQCLADRRFILLRVRNGRVILSHSLRIGRVWR